MVSSPMSEVPVTRIRVTGGESFNDLDPRTVAPADANGARFRAIANEHRTRRFGRPSRRMARAGTASTAALLELDAHGRRHLRAQQSAGVALDGGRATMYFTTLSWIVAVG